MIICFRPDFNSRCLAKIATVIVTLFYSTFNIGHNIYPLLSKSIVSSFSFFSVFMQTVLLINSNSAERSFIIVMRKGVQSSSSLAAYGYCGKSKGLYVHHIKAFAFVAS